MTRASFIVDSGGPLFSLTAVSSSEERSAIRVWTNCAFKCERYSSYTSKVDLHHIIYTRKRSTENLTSRIAMRDASMKAKGWPRRDLQIRPEQDADSGFIKLEAELPMKPAYSIATYTDLFRRSRSQAWRESHLGFAHKETRNPAALDLQTRRDPEILGTVSLQSALDH